MTDQTQNRLSPGLKLALELGPLLIYFLITFKVHERFGFDWGEEVYRPAVIWLIISTPIQVAVLWWGERKVPWSALITAIFLVGFGLVSLALGDDRWIKAKPSIVYLFFAGALATGLMTRRPLLKFVLGSQIDATDAQWRQLSVNFTLFFVALAALNEVLWRGIDLFMVQYFAGLPGSPSDPSFQAWSATKPAFMVLSFVFTMWQLWPLLQGKIEAEEEKSAQG